MQSAKCRDWIESYESLEEPSSEWNEKPLEGFFRKNYVLIASTEALIRIQHGAWKMNGNRMMGMKRYKE